MSTHETNGGDEAPLSTELVAHTQETVTQMLQHWREVKGSSRSSLSGIELDVGDDGATVRRNTPDAVEEVQLLRDSNGAWHFIDIGQRSDEPENRGVIQDRLDTTISPNGSRKLIRTIDSSNGEHREEVYEYPISVGDLQRCEATLSDVNRRIDLSRRTGHGWLDWVLRRQTEHK